ncbi:MAG: DUF5668 domain-containing protein [Xanthomonadaceae bacterium]|jgi:uncharacterized membrane protein|nr:DUF5668 domain-containing protein [Xanthomonadaceae bacterium]
MKPHFVTASILIVVGLILLVNNLGLANLNLGKLIVTWWPAILVCVGVSMLFHRNK